VVRQRETARFFSAACCARISRTDQLFSTRREFYQYVYTKFRLDSCEEIGRASFGRALCGVRGSISVLEHAVSADVLDRTL